MNLLAFLFMVLMQSSTPSLQGIVLKTGTVEPVGKATVELRRSDGTDPRVRSVTTASDGRFSFAAVPPGEYQLQVSRPGYVRATYGERKPGGPGTPIMIPSDTSEIRMMLTPTGVITGRISDRLGRPLGNATVQAMRISYSAGRQSLAEVQSTLTNDLGEYRLFFLTPGRYYVGATPVSSARGIGSGSGTDSIRDFRMQREATRTQAIRTDEVDVPSYFPGTTDQLAAAPIELKPAAEIRGIDIIAAPVRAQHVRGVIVGFDASQPIPGTVSMRMSTPNGSRVTGSTAPNFDLSGVMPGTYILSTTIGTMSGRIPIEVFDRDLDNVTLRISPSFSVPGRLVVEGASPENPGPDVKTLRVTLRSDPPDSNPITPPTPAADGSFTLQSVPIGTYRVSLLPAMQNGYLKSVKLGIAEGIQSGITLQGPPEGLLQIVVSARPGTIEGRIFSERKEPLANATVVLVPESSLRTTPTDLYKNVTTSPTGEFKLQGLTPGNYKLFAWQEVENGSWLNAEFMRENEDRGRAVVVSEGSSERIDLLAIPN